MIEPSIRGSIFRSAVEDLLRERDAGRLHPDALESSLEPRDVEMLEGKILDGAWYPMDTYTRLIELLCQTVAGGSRVYYAERGAKNAQRLMDAGAYAQLDLLGSFTEERDAYDFEDEAQLEAAMRTFQDKLERVVSLAGAIYNVGQWGVEGDPDAPARAVIEILEAEDYSEGMRLAIEGFFNQCVRLVPGAEISRLFRSERVEPDHIRIRMTMDLPTALAARS